MPSNLSIVSYPTEYIRQQYSSVKAYIEDDCVGQGTLCISENQLVWAVLSSETNRQGIAIDYPSLTMHGIVTHDPKFSEEHLVVIVEKTKNEEDNNDATNGDEERSDSPIEYDSIQTMNYRFMMATPDDLKTAYQIIAECQALHPDPLDDMVEDDEVGSDIDYGDEDESNQNGNGNGYNGDDDPYGYNAHFTSTRQTTRGARFGHHQQIQYDDQDENDDADQNQQSD